MFPIPITRNQSYVQRRYNNRNFFNNFSVKYFYLLVLRLKLQLSTMFVYWFLLLNSCFGHLWKVDGSASRINRLEQ
ncbi:unnamed protein product [Acanthoscelides obtectus]|uniref:Uncharacterized protein n=1 Tax=Acanthoscelides obtectus TaxID=200917 RepID=A0A9P0KFB6_ACAOB|nr:unnamed protein product [Acanthoscelides obtectus]